MKKEYGIRERKSMAARVLAICVMTTFVFAGTAMGAVSRYGLVGEWHFDEDAKDTSGIGNDGTINGSTFVDGVRGKALNFNGRSDYVNMGDGASLNPTSAITMETWVKFNSLSATQYFLSKPYTSAYEPYHQYGLIALTTRKINFALTFGGNRQEFSTSQTITTGQWYHIVGTYDGNVMKVYINGTQDPSTLSVSGSISTYSTNLTIGRWSPTPQFFNGLIDEVRIYNRALSADEIKASYEAIASPDTTPPTISITSPASGQTFNTNTITVNGTASDEISLSKIEIKVGSGSWNLASGTNSWSRLATLSSGSNMIYARATDTSGNTGEAWVSAEYLTPASTGKVTPTPTPTLTPAPTTTPTVTSTRTTTPAPTATPERKQPLLTVSQTTLKEEPEVGEEVLITVTLQNTGDATARNIRLTEQIPSSIAVSYIDGANKPGNLVTWEGELAPNRAHAIVHTFKILEKKDRCFPVIIRYQDEEGNEKMTSSQVCVSAKEIPTPTPTPVWTKAPENPVPTVQNVKLPGFTAPMVLIGFVIVVLLVRRR